jgi:hypothetical protein
MTVVFGVVARGDEGAEAASDKAVGGVGAPDPLVEPKRCALALPAPTDLLNKIGRHAEAVEAVKSFAFGDEMALFEGGFGSGQGQQTKIDTPIGAPDPRPTKCPLPVAGHFRSNSSAYGADIHRREQIAYG